MAQVLDIFKRRYCCVGPLRQIVCFSLEKFLDLFLTRPPSHPKTLMPTSKAIHSDDESKQGHELKNVYCHGPSLVDD